MIITRLILQISDNSINTCINTFSQALLDSYFTIGAQIRCISKLTGKKVIRPKWISAMIIDFGHYVKTYINHI